MPTNDEVDHKGSEAAEFVNSHRGQYIMSQALYIAIEVMKQVDGEFQERSNIKDMEYLRDNLWPMYTEIQAMGLNNLTTHETAHCAEGDSDNG